jgi:hypothetical protein
LIGSLTPLDPADAQRLQLEVAFNEFVNAFSNNN